MTEHSTQSAILDLIRLRGGVATRVNSGSAIFKRDGKTQVIKGADKGTSDIIALYKGVYLAIEVKDSNNVATPEQVEFLKQVANAGGIGLVAYDVEFVNGILSEAENGVGILDILFNESGWDISVAPNQVYVGFYPFCGTCGAELSGGER